MNNHLYGPTSIRIVGSGDLQNEQAKAARYRDEQREYQRRIDSGIDDRTGLALTHQQACDLADRAKRADGHARTIELAIEEYQEAARQGEVYGRAQT